MPRATVEDCQMFSTGEAFLGCSAADSGAERIPLSIVIAPWVRPRRPV